MGRAVGETLGEVGGYSLRVPPGSDNYPDEKGVSRSLLSACW